MSAPFPLASSSSSSDDSTTARLSQVAIPLPAPSTHCADGHARLHLPLRSIERFTHYFGIVHPLPTPRAPPRAQTCLHPGTIQTHKKNRLPITQDGIPQSCNRYLHCQASNEMWALLLAMTTVAAVVAPGATYGLNATALVDWEAHTPVPPSLVCVCVLLLAVCSLTLSSWD